MRNEKTLIWSIGYCWFVSNRQNTVNPEFKYADTHITAASHAAAERLSPPLSALPHADKLLLNG